MKCQKIVLGEFLLLGAGSVHSVAWFLPPHGATVQRRQELSAICHASTIDAYLRAEPDWH